MYNPLLRRTLVSLLIVVIPISAMIAWILYNKKTAMKSEAIPVVQNTSFGGANWTIFRGDTQLTGVAEGNLPDKLKLVWKFETAGEIKSTPIIVSETVYVSSLDKHLYAIGLKTGKEKWRFEADDELDASPVFFDNTIYVGSNSGTFYAIGTEKGRPKWTYDKAGRISGSANIATESDTGKPVVVFGSHDNYLYCLDATGEKLVFKHPAQNYINGAVAVANNTAFFGSCDAMLYQVPLNDPDALQQIDTGSYVASNPAIRDSVIYAGNYDGRFLAADIATQKIIWSFDETEDAFFSSPAVDDHVVIVGCRDKKLYCFDKTDGTVRWTFLAADSFDSSPVICGDKVIVGNDDGRLYLINIQTEKEVFSYTLGSPIASSPAIARNHVLIGCDNGTVYAFTEK